MGTTNISVHRFGLSEVYVPTPSNSAVADLVFVHGLNGDPHETWTSKDTDVFWPAQLLPQFIEESKARVLVYGYDADVTSFGGKGVTKDKIHNHAERLNADLSANRRIRKAAERPIIFIAHSLGGLVVKRALIASSEISGPKTEHLRSIFISTYGILFLGTPHKGSDLASWGSFLESLSRAVMLKKAVDSAPQLVDALKSNSETLQNIDRQFIQLMDEFHMFFFHEAKPTNLGGTLRFVVDEESAAPSLPDVERASIQADHSHMCKFESESSPGFDLIVDAIQRYAESSPATISARWTSEREQSKTQRIRKAKELFPDSVIQQEPPSSDTASTSSHTPGSSTHDLLLSQIIQKQDSPKLISDASDPIPKSTEPYFIVPPGFRENTFFVGMEKELALLDKNLFKKHRTGRTACVLLHGPAGSGKSHLARQYVHKNRSKFQGGIFWINAKLKDELYKDYWQIAQKVVAKDSPELRISGGDEAKSFVDVVRTWFESRNGWLIILDGIIIDNEEDTVELQRFIPNSANSSLLYISMAQVIDSKERLLRPTAVKVPPLKESDARKLLFKEIGKSSPSDAEKKHATELVKQVGGLPLAISAISHRLAETHERLETYKIHSYSADRKLGGPYHQIMQDLQERGHIEAYNLINILCFFGSHIPVEMVHLGLKALRHDKIEVKSGITGAKPDIDTTYGILIRSALIERNEPDDKDSMSSSRDSLVDPEPIDMLKVHSVVQNFCCDALKANNVLPSWLGYAVHLFCHSYEEADFRIKTKTEPARVSDYREYLVHAHSLRGHLLKYERKSQYLSSIHEELESTITQIELEVKSREPGSSQESVARTEFQISIFDRTSSSSSSAFSEPGVRPLGYRPTPLPLGDESLYGMPLGNKSFDSPRSIGTVSPGYEPKIVDHSPRTRIPSLYNYNFERDDFPMAYEMQKSLSDNTARPTSANEDSHDTGWQTVLPNKKIRKPRYPRDLGNFRASPATPARAEIDKRYAMGSVTQPPQESRGRLSGSSEAVTSLTAVHRASPPPARGGGVIWSRGSSSRSPAPSRLTYAKVAAGQLHRPSSSHQPNDINDTLMHGDLPSSSPPLLIDRGRSLENNLGQSGLPQQSPLRTEVVPPIFNPSLHQAQFVPQLQSPQLSNQGNIRSRSASNRQLSPSTYQRQQENYSPYQRPVISGPNPEPLPIDSNVPITSKRPASSALVSQYSPSALPQFARHPSTPDAQYPLSPTFPLSASFPPGYYSQPTSRIHSQQSHTSAETEPPLPYHSSIRSRLPDGSPSHKSPKLANSYPIPQRSDSLAYDSSPHNNTAPHSDPTLLSHAGGWAAYPFLHFSPGSGSGSHHGDCSPPAALSMSRGSSNLSAPPSYKDPSSTHGQGLGILAFDPDSEIHFGNFDEPVRAVDVRRRNHERQERLLAAAAAAEEEARRLRGDDIALRLWRSGENRAERSRSNPPYPETNLIPTESDPEFLEAMAEGRRGGG